MKGLKKLTNNIKQILRKSSLTTLGIVLIIFLLTLSLLTTVTERKKFMKDHPIYKVLTSTKNENTSNTFDEKAYNSAITEFDKKSKDYEIEYQKAVIKACGPELKKTGESSLDVILNRGKRNSCESKLRYKDIVKDIQNKVLPDEPLEPNKQQFVTKCEKKVTKKIYIVLGFEAYTKTSEGNVTCNKPN